MKLTLKTLEAVGSILHKEMYNKGIAAAIQLSPLVSIKSWWHMRVGSTWCSLNERMKVLPTNGVSKLPRKGC